MPLHGDFSHSGVSKSAKKQQSKTQISSATKDPKSASDKKKPDTKPLEVNYVPRIQILQKECPNDLKSNHSEHDEKNDDANTILSTDSSFEDELSNFCKRLEDQESDSNTRKSVSKSRPTSQKKKRKLKPNVSRQWVSRIQKRLDSLYNRNERKQFDSPRPSDKSTPDTSANIKLNCQKNQRDSSITSQSTATNGGGRNEGGKLSKYSKKGINLKDSRLSSETKQDINLHRICI